MQQAPSEGRHSQQSARGEDKPDERRRALKEAVETAASAYFSACRKLARAINRLKQG